MIRFVDTYYIRAPQGADANAAAGNKPEANKDANTDNTAKPEEAQQPEQQQAAANGATTCPPSDDLSGTSQAATFKNVIFQHGYAENANPQVPITIHYDSLKISGSHPYHRQHDNPDGPLGIEGRTVYSVKATYHVCWEYQDHVEITDYTDHQFSCLQGQAGEWTCNETGGKPPTTKTVQK
jgi:hypothetical protein